MNDDVTVFVVDDDAAIRDSLRYSLESAGWHVETFGSGEDFLARFVPGQKACVILDLHMPIMNGLAVQRQLAQRGCHPPIIFVTAYGEVSTSVRAMQQGAYEFLEKPVDGDRLLELVRESVEQDALDRTEKLADRDVRQRLSRLTEEEKQVFALLLRAKPVEVIADALEISEDLAAERRASVLEKFDVPNEVQLLRFLIQHAPDVAGQAPF